MTAGSIAGTLLLAAMSTVDNLVELYAVWIGIGLASAMVLYEAAFAVVITWHPTDGARANALLAVTVVAGFASRIFLPLTGAAARAPVRVAAVSAPITAVGEARRSWESGVRKTAKE
jgi:hypothetical protein